jgi:hypothetical protein
MPPFVKEKAGLVSRLEGDEPRGGGLGGWFVTQITRSKTKGSTELAIFFGLETTWQRYCAGCSWVDPSSSMSSA